MEVCRRDSGWIGPGVLALKLKGFFVMRKILSLSSSRSRGFACVAAAVLVIAVAPPASAEEQGLKDGAKRAGHAVGAVAHDIGHGAKQVGKEIGQGAKKAGKAIGDAAKEGGKEFRRAVKGE